MAPIFFSPTIGPVPISVVLKEQHSASLGITEQPIETGAKVTDHAYVEPKRLSLEIADENAVATHGALLRLQESRIPFTIISGLKIYSNMLIKSIRADRDVRTSNILSGTVELQEAIIVSTAYTTTEGEDPADVSNGQAGGKNSTRAARPTSNNTTGAATQDRAAGTAVRGDIAEKTVGPQQNKSIAARIFGP